jgi:hypothetical protein
MELGLLFELPWHRSNVDVLSRRGRCGNATFAEFYGTLDSLTHLFFVYSSTWPVATNRANIVPACFNSRGID